MIASDLVTWIASSARAIIIITNLIPNNSQLSNHHRHTQPAHYSHYYLLFSVLQHKIASSTYRAILGSVNFCNIKKNQQRELKDTVSRCCVCVCIYVWILCYFSLLLQFVPSAVSPRISIHQLSRKFHDFQFSAKFHAQHLIMKKLLLCNELNLNVIHFFFYISLC